MTDGEEQREEGVVEEILVQRQRERQRERTTEEGRGEVDEESNEQLLPPEQLLPLVTQARLPLRRLPVRYTHSSGLRYQEKKSEPLLTREAREKHAKLQDDWTAPLVHYDTVKKLAQQPSPDIYLIDVREPDETTAGMIPSAVALPLSNLPHSLHTNRNEFRRTHGFDKPLLEQEIVFYCRSGKRSQTAADVARRNGYTNVKSYDGSWLDWIKREQQPQSK